MKKLIKMLTVVVIIGLFSLNCSAAEADKYLDEFGEILPEEYKESAVSDGTLIESLGISAVLYEIHAALTGEGGRVGAFLLLLIGLVSLSAVTALVPTPNKKICEAGVGALSSIAIYRSIYPLFSELTAALSGVGEFMCRLSPLLAAVTLAGGGVSGASVQSAGMATVLGFFGGASSALFSAVSGFTLAMSLVSSFGGEGGASVLRATKNSFNWLLGIATALLMGTLSLQTLVATARDSAGMRAAKYAASGLIPIVGGTVSGALSTLASGLSYVKGVVGAGSIFVILSMGLSPLVLLLLYRLALSLSVSMASLLGAAAAERTVGSYRFLFDTLIALYCLSLLVYIFMIILFVKSGVALL